MPTILTAAMDGSPVVRFHHLSLISHYLQIAYRHADPTDSSAGDLDDLSRAIIAITFSAMTFEAFANEVAEDTFSDAELQNFISLKGQFKKPKGITGIGHKMALLFSKKLYPPLPAAIAAGIDELVQLRNSLVHYKLSDMAGKSYHPPMRSTPMADGGLMWSVNFMERAVRVEPPFLAKVNKQAAIRSYNTAYDFACLWSSLQSPPSEPRGFKRLEA